MTIHKEMLESEIMQNYSNTTGLIIQHKNNIIYEQYFNGCNEESTLNMFSVTKTIVSLLIGIALDNNLIQSLDTPINYYYPNYNLDDSITLKDFMNMKVDYKFKKEPYIKYFRSTDCVSFALNYVNDSKDNFFRYTPLIGIDVVSGVLTKATDLSACDFANKYLFKPLGINQRQSITLPSQKDYFKFIKSTNNNGWVTDLNGVNTAGWGLTLSTREMLKIGQLFLEDGLYNNTQVVSKKYINEATKTHNVWKELNLNYGHLIWILNDNIFAAMGDGGNTIYINKDKELVVAMSGVFKPNVKDRIDFIQEFIEPYLDE